MERAPAQPAPNTMPIAGSQHSHAPQRQIASTSRSILNPPQQQRCAEAGDDRTDEQKAQIANDRGEPGMTEADHAEGVAEVRERKGLRDRTDAGGELLQRGEGAGEREDGEQIKDGELDRLRLRAAEGGDAIK